MFTTIWSAVLTLGLIIFVHELGHFLVAKKMGIKVEVFSLGFGPRLLGFKRGETDYRVSLFPLGGYVKMPGEGLDYENEDNGTGEGNFSTKPIWKRISVMAAGPAMNIILAFLLLSLIFMVGAKIPIYPLKIGFIEKGSRAEEAGLLVGDKILAINGDEMDSWDQINRVISLSANENLVLTIQRDGEILKKAVVPSEDPKLGIGTIGIFYFVEAEIGEVMEGRPAERAGLKAGDKIISLDGKTVNGWWELSDIIHNRPGDEVTLEVQRGEEILEFSVTPELDPQVGVGLIGITMPPVETEILRYGPPQAVAQGVKRGIGIMRDTVWTIGMLVSGRISVKSVGGPIMIAQMSGRFASSGLSDFLTFLSFISISLAIFNLIPVPVLDGGRILFLLIEKSKGKPVSLKWREVSLQIGVVLLIVLMVYISINDVLRTLR